MAQFKDMLKYLRSREKLSQAELAKKLGVAKSTVSMYEVGKREPDFETLEAIARFFNVDMNFLLGQRTPENQPGRSLSLTPRDEKDIEKILSQTKEQLLSQDGLMFDGKPASTEAIDSILSAMQIGMEMAKKKNKEKYTPKKYREESSSLL